MKSPTRLAFYALTLLFCWHAVAQTAVPADAQNAVADREAREGDDPIAEVGINHLPSDIRYQVNALIADRMAQTHMAGLALAVVQHGKPVYVQGFGMADIETQARVTARTRFEIGSETKSFTALGVLRLYDDPSLIRKPGIKRLALDQPLTTYLSDTPTFHLPPKWQGITVRELLAMAGGIEDFGSNHLTWEEILNQVGELDLLFYPGTGFCYSNPGYMLLGEVLQQLTQRDYGSFMDRFVFGPLGMAHSAIHLDTRPANVATGYSWATDTWVTPEYRPGSSSFSSGAMVTSAADLARFLQAASQRRVLRASAYDLMWTRAPFYTPRGQTLWGLGWEVSVLDSAPQRYRIFRKDGGLPGYSAQLYIDDLNEVSVALSTNTDQQMLASLAAQIAALVAGLEGPIDPPGTGGNCWVETQP